MSSKSVLQSSNAPNSNEKLQSVGHAKVILLGEHAAVFGRHIIAAPIPLAIQTAVEPAESGVIVMIPAWQVTLNLADRVDDARAKLKQTAFIASS